MIFFSHKHGQLGNRLFAFAHLIASAKANGWKIVNLSFDEYAQYFEITRRDVYCRYPSAGKREASGKLRSFLFFLNRALLKMLRTVRWISSWFHRVIVADLPEYQFGDSRCFDLDAAPFKQLARTRPVVFLFGRFFRDYGHLEEHQDAIRTFFSPTTEIQARVSRFVAHARAGVDWLVGVHVRLGDYRQFADGKYFFSLEEYASRMKELADHALGKRIRFVICSNEMIDARPFSEVSFIFGPGHLVDDMYIFAQCDMIMGPPSTYTLWASFYGKRPLYQIREIQRPVRPESFVMLPPRVLYNFSFN